MDIGRDSFPGLGPDDIEVRLYWDNDDDSIPRLPSVTTILKTRNEDKSNLYAWQDRNDGNGDNADHEHLFWYKRHRGTLSHWYALKTLDPGLEWSGDEQQSVWALGNVSKQTDPEKYPETYDARPRDVLYSILKAEHAVESWGEFYDAHPPDNDEAYFEDELKALYERERDHFVEVFDRITRKLGITPESTIAVEQFVFDTEYEYAGQVDLVYEDPDGNIVVADLKTSSGCYSKHKIQGAAYAKAIERDENIPVDEVDRLEVIRIHPDSGAYAVHTDNPSHPMHTSKYWRQSYDQLWETFASLAENFEYDDASQ